MFEAPMARGRDGTAHADSQVRGMSPSGGQEKRPLDLAHRSAGRIRVAMEFAFAAVVVFSLISSPPTQAGSGAKAPPPLPAFEVATVKPSDPSLGMRGRGGLLVYPGGRIRAVNCTVRTLVSYAFNVQSFQVSGGPGWVGDDRYDVAALPPDSSSSVKTMPPSPRTPPTDEQRQMLEALLMDRFQLKFHQVNKIGPVYVLERGDRELRLVATQNKKDFPWLGAFQGGMINGDGLTGRNISMPEVALRLGRYLDRPVVDQTGLKGTYDFRIQYGKDDSDRDVLSCIFGSLKLMGLRLKPTKAPIKEIVIDHIDRPSEN